MPLLPEDARELGRIGALTESNHEKLIEVGAKLDAMDAELKRHAQASGERIGKVEQQIARWSGALVVVGIIWTIFQAVILATFTVWIRP